MITRRGLIGGLAVSAMITEAMAKKPAQPVPPWLQAFYDKAWKEFEAKQRASNYGLAVVHYDGKQIQIDPIEPRELYNEPS